MIPFRVFVSFFLLASICLGDVWVVTPAGYYVMTLTTEGAPVLTPAANVTSITVMGKPPIVPPVDPPNPPDPPSEDKWGAGSFERTRSK